MLNLDPETQCITCPQGDTGLLLASITALDGQPLAQPLDGVAVFAVCQQIGGVFSTIKAKQVELVDNTATILISNDFFCIFIFFTPPNPIILPIIKRFHQPKQPNIVMIGCVLGCRYLQKKTPDAAVCWPCIWYFSFLDMNYKVQTTCI